MPPISVASSPLGVTVPPPFACPSRRPCVAPASPCFAFYGTAQLGARLQSCEASLAASRDACGVAVAERDRLRDLLRRLEEPITGPPHGGAPHEGARDVGHGQVWSQPPYPHHPQHQHEQHPQPQEYQQPHKYREHDSWRPEAQASRANLAALGRDTQPPGQQGQQGRDQYPDRGQDRGQGLADLRCAERPGVRPAVGPAENPDPQPATPPAEQPRRVARVARQFFHARLPAATVTSTAGDGDSSDGGSAREGSASGGTARLAASLEADVAALDDEIAGLRATLEATARRTTATILAEVLPRARLHAPTHAATEMHAAPQIGTRT